MIRTMLATFVGVALVGMTPNLFVVPATLPVRSLKEFVDYSKAHPGKLAGGHPGTGTFGHLGMLLFSGHSGIDLVSVPYKSLPQAVPDLLSGQLSFMILTSTFAMPHIRSGKLTALAVNTPKRLAELPEVPTAAEAGLPPDVIDKVNAAINRAIRTQAFMARFGSIGDEPAGGPPEEFAATIARDSAKWGDVVKRAGVKLD